MASVMIVEDDAVLGRSIAAHLSSEGFEVEVVESTFAALDRLDARKFNLVLSDIAMPRGMPNGVSLARMARVRDPQCHVMLMTGYADLAQEGDRYHSQVFAKPVDLDKLTAAIRKHVAA